MIKPQCGYILCKKIVNEKDSVIESGIKYDKESMPIYEVMSISNLSIGLDLISGDKIITNSIPTKVKYEDEYYYLVNQDYIAAKVN